MQFVGEIAALGAATLWAFGSMLFALTAKRSGAFALNLVRITLALFFLTLLLTLTRGPGWFLEASRGDALILALSGVVGLTLGDWGYFGALARLGPRLGALLMTLAPPTTAILAVPLLGESLGVLSIVGMIVTLGGVAWVVVERPADPAPRGHRIVGVIFGCIGSFGQGFGLVLSKMGMEQGVDPLAATGIRMAAATVSIWILALASGWMGKVARLLRDRISRWASLGASFLGPVFGVWLSLIAVNNAKAGVAATLLSTTPVVILPLVILFYRERVSYRAALGAAVAVAGVALLFIS
jgi:drug/metabolite transporter (DMT)-like permease